MDKLPSWRNDLNPWKGAERAHKTPAMHEYDYHVMAQQAAAVSPSNNAAAGLHPAMAQLPMMPAGLNLSMSAANQLMAAGGLQHTQLGNSNTPRHLGHGSALVSSTSPHGAMGGIPHGKAKSKKPKVNKDGIPAPKRATTAYINFTQWYREQMKKSGKQIPRIGEFGKECAAKWNSMTEEDKQPFLDSAAKDRERYKREMAIYKPARDANKPKRPGTAFMLFMKDLRREMAGREPEGGVAALAKLGGERWRNMKEEEKRPYIESQNEEKLRYEELMEDYRRQQGADEPLPKQPRMQLPNMQDEQGHDSISGDEGRGGPGTPQMAPGTPQMAAQSHSAPGSGESTPTHVGAPSPHTHSMSPSPGMGSTPPNPNSVPFSTPMSLAQLSPAHSAALQMSYNQHGLPNFALPSGVLAPAPNYNQAHMAGTAQYLGSSSGSYSQGHIPGHYNWT
ncbi:uncharacterized protein LOC106478739 isoform X2 [Limulus polyphemus]|uniref:Uncharacterized protein LOC106478739 isoform X2 n=1 Tax=Limulus polyphemus TaxID=6850 RepID=A0ABM1C5V2_LIMPO|nr:uncharacterized protein LOC106478739 isoform X2 [Limulus polyphemus]